MSLLQAQPSSQLAAQMWSSQHGNTLHQLPALPLQFPSPARAPWGRCQRRMPAQKQASGSGLAGASGPLRGRRQLSLGTSVLGMRSHSLPQQGGCCRCLWSSAPSSSGWRGRLLRTGAMQVHLLGAARALAAVCSQPCPTSPSLTPAKVDLQQQLPFCVSSSGSP